MCLSQIDHSKHHVRHKGVHMCTWHQDNRSSMIDFVVVSSDLKRKAELSTNHHLVVSWLRWLGRMLDRRWNFSTSCTSSGSFPIREVTFLVPRTSFCSWGSDRQGPCLQLLLNSHPTPFTSPALVPPVVSPWEGSPMFPHEQRSGHQALAIVVHPRALLQDGCGDPCPGKGPLVL